MLASLEPTWVLCSSVESIHRWEIGKHGGSHGIRDKSLLLSAIESPRNRWHYEEPQPSIIALAATYAFKLTRNHPFVDGNKRTSCAVCMLFLADNGGKICATDEEKEHVFLSLAAGKMSEKELNHWLETHSV